MPSYSICIGKCIARERGREIERQRKRERERERGTERERERETDRQTDRQTDRHIDRERDRETEVETLNGFERCVECTRSPAVGLDNSCVDSRINNPRATKKSNVYCCHFVPRGRLVQSVSESLTSLR